MWRGRCWEQACSASVLPPKSPSIQTAQFFPRHCPICTAHGYSQGNEAKVLISHHMVTLKHADQGSGKSQSLVITAPLHRSLKVGACGKPSLLFFDSPQERKLTLQPSVLLRMEASTRPKQEDAGLSTFPSRERALTPHSTQTFCQGIGDGESRDKSALTLSDAFRG